MKIKPHLYRAAVVAAFLAFAGSLLAQGSETVTADQLVVGQGLIPAWLISALTVIGGLRLALKPVMSGVATFIASTPTKADDTFLSGLLQSKGWKAFEYGLDWFASIKVGNRLNQK